jgi:glycerol-3-phosphate acyltransferase PlsX
MSSSVRIALDAMGGDHGPSVVVPGAALAFERHPDTEFLLFGDEAVVGPLLAAHPKLKAKANLVHTTVAIGMADKPSQALRYGRWKSSMWLALDAVKKHEAHAAVSAGNTGALMALSRYNLKLLAGIERPAIAGLWPTLKGESVVLDIGASIGADAHHLVNLAVMGAAMARVLFDIEKPTVGLLNIGVEEVKGLEEVREAGAILRGRASPELDYIGFVEGDDIGKGTSDVIVTEGFSGNIALKSAEGTARQLMQYLRSSIERTWHARLGYLLARAAFRAVRDKMDPAKSNGGVFLGLNGVVIKSHGGTSVDGFASAVDIAYDMVRYDLLEKIHDSIARDRDATSARVAGAAS